MTTLPPHRLSARHPLAGLLLGTLTAALAPAQSFPCEKYQLDNGMTVILRPDHSLPSAVVNLWYRVGSKDELPGRSGFAHLFEHLMFMGTERVPGNDFDVLMEAGGGSNNASTSEDRTNYFSSGPAELLPTLLWLDADRLEDLARTMTQQKLDRQRDIVRNEIRQNVENRPYGRAEERVFRIMFPVGHPYHEAVYGTHEDLEAATVDNVKDFFATYYVPNNASLVVAGDFDPAQIKPMVAELFGSLPRGADVGRRSVPDAQLGGVVRATMLDRVELPLVKIVWHSPVAYAPGDAEAILLARVLASGKSSRLYKRLVFDDHIATDVSADQDSLALGSLFSIDVTAAPGADLDRLERTVDEELERLRRDGLPADELARHVASYEFGRLARWQSLGAVADQLNRYEFVWGEPDSFQRDLDRFRAASPDAVRDVARGLDPARRAILRVLPEQPAHAASARDHRPGPQPAAAFAAPLPESFRLHNGMPVHFWRKTELPLVAIQVQFQNGTVLSDPAHAGLLQLTASMLQEGAGDLDALAFGNAVQALGAQLGIGASHEVVTGSATVVQRNFGAAAGLLAEALRQPRLQSADWERVKRLHLDGLRQLDDEPNAVAGRVGQRVMFGRDNPYGWPFGGTVATVTPLSLDDVRRCHAAIVDPRNATILLAGDLTVDAAREVLERTFGEWQGDGAPAAAKPAPAAAAASYAPLPATDLRVVVVDRKAAVQTVVRFFAPGPSYRNDQRMHLQLLGTILGGSFTSRLNQNLREQHGYTYGAGCSYMMAPRTGWFSARTSVRTDVTGPSVQELLRELRRIGGGERADVTAAELGKAQETLRAETVQQFGTLFGILGNAAELALNGMPFTSTATDLATARRLTADDLNAIGRDAVRLDRGVLVLVGDADKIRAQLQGLDLPAPIEFDVDGEPVTAPGQAGHGAPAGR